MNAYAFGVFLIWYFVIGTIIEIVVFIVPTFRRWFINLIVQFWTECWEAGLKVFGEIFEKEEEKIE